MSKARLLVAIAWWCKSGWSLRWNGLWGCLRCRYLGSSAAFDDLVQFATVQPDTAAFRAIVNLDPAAVSHNKGLAIHRAKHLHLLRCVALEIGTPFRPYKHASLKGGKFALNLSL